MDDAYIGAVVPWPSTMIIPRGWVICDGRTMYIAQHAALFAVIGVAYGGDGKSTYKIPDLRGRVPYIHTMYGYNPYVGSAPSTINGQWGQPVILNQYNLPVHTHTATFTPTGGSPHGVLTASGMISLPVNQIAGTFSGTGSFNGATPTATPRSATIAANDLVTSPGTTPQLFTSIGTPVTLGASNAVSVTGSVTMTGTAAGNVTIGVSGTQHGFTGGTITVLPTGNTKPVTISPATQPLNFIICVDGVFPPRN
ncbi:phage tail protein [Nitrospirillum sp. BR 11828]|uniref:phage tail protein n=1 Tax=Nitrospirillum sp. BR 11828 TaxID=3104325 RepID=UPI002ACABD26|nr:phage tail protein [Nitrospirillum sp. BR 11828]MDZ5645891.1 phage tail protein [Nitrospirillum sp. BR 11828]